MERWLKLGLKYMRFVNLCRLKLLQFSGLYSLLSQKIYRVLKWRVITKNCVDVLKDSCFHVAWPILTLISDAVDLSISFAICNFSWDRREVNTTPHSLAKFNLLLLIGLIFAVISVFFILKFWILAWRILLLFLFYEISVFSKIIIIYGTLQSECIACNQIKEILKPTKKYGLPIVKKLENKMAKKFT